jgi:PRTRC genetic system protein B
MEIASEASLPGIRWPFTRHQVALHKDGPPTLEPAQPLTTGFLESLVRSLYGGAMAEILPENVLAKGDRMIAWWTPACRRQMFYETSEQKCAELNGRTFPQPALVWRVHNDDLKIRALTVKQRPAAATKLAVAPSGIFRRTVVSAPERCAGRITRRRHRFPIGSAASMRAPSPTPM